MADIVGTAGNDLIDGTLQGDDISGLGGNDTLNGSDGSDFLDGGAGDDTLNGEGDDDTLYDTSGLNLLDGGAGNDTLLSYSPTSGQILIGGAGNDRFLLLSANGSTLTGGSGIDTYELDAGRTGNVITDFAAGAGGDVIDVTYLLRYLAGYSGPNPFGTGHLLVQQSGADTLLRIDPDGAAGGAPIPPSSRSPAFLPRR